MGHDGEESDGGALALPLCSLIWCGTGVAEVVRPPDDVIKTQARSPRNPLAKSVVSSREARNNGRFLGGSRKRHNDPWR